MKESKEEFEARYIEGMHIPSFAYHDQFVTLSCNCGQRTCKGWAAIENNKSAINTHVLRFGEHNER